MSLLRFLKLLNGAAAPSAPPVDPEMTFEVTTTGASQILTINELRTEIGQAVNVDWGDGLNNNYTSTGTTGNNRTHTYAAAGTYTITIDLPERITHFDIRDTKVSLLPGEQLCKMVNLTNFRVLTVPATALVWTVGPAAPMFPLVQYLQIELQNNFVWTVNGDFPPINDVLNLRGLPGLTWNINPTNPMPVLAESITIRDSTGVTYTSSMENVPDVTIIRIENGWNATQINAFLRDLRARLESRNVSGDPVGTVDLLGSGNAAPTGQGLTDKADLTTVGTHRWVSVTTA